jgi:hypothetical protein
MDMHNTRKKLLYTAVCAVKELSTRKKAFTAAFHCEPETLHKLSDTSDDENR